jgi:hypothetical protein
MNKQTFLHPILILTLVCTLVSPALALYQGPAPYPPKFLHGNRINLYPGMPDLTLPVDEPCFVIHGWIHNEWNEFSSEERRDFLGNDSFSLSIDGTPIAVRRLLMFYKIFETPSSTLAMTINFYILFKANHFEPGTYTFTGVWSTTGYVSDPSSISVTFV